VSHLESITLCDMAFDAAGPSAAAALLTWPGLALAVTLALAQFQAQVLAVAVTMACLEAGRSYKQEVQQHGTIKLMHCIVCTTCARTAPIRGHVPRYGH